MLKEKSKEIEQYQLTKEEEKEVNLIYDDVEKMIDQRNQTYKQFNDRTLVNYIDDSEKRLNGYVPSRESQDKKDWQANVFHPDTRNKLKAIVASVALTPPDSKYRAVGNDGGLDLKRAELMKELVRHSYYQQNPEVEIFFDAWGGAGRGTIIKHEGYLKTKYKRRFIKSYDLSTGAVESEEREVNVDNKCIEVDVPLSELYIRDFHIFDIQKQPSLAWIKYLDKDAAEGEFGQYKNWQYVPTKPPKGFGDDNTTFFNQRWAGRTDEDEYEVIRYYNKYQDKYDIIVNGVPLLIAPLLWGKRDKKYPFAKSIFEPFEGRDFFYGNSLPNSLMGQQDIVNQLYNMGLDKTYRSMNPPMLANIANKDLLETENDSIGMDTTLYVEDINQVQYQAIPGVTAPEQAMLQLVSRGIDLTTVDANQQGVAGRGVTAREIVIANENAKKLKGIFFMFLKDLWVQKTKLRILNILMNYTQPIVTEVVGEDGAVTYQDSFRTFNIEDSKFPDGRTGLLSVQMVGGQGELPSAGQLAEEESQWKETGENFQKVAMTSDYLDNYDYDVQIITDSTYQQEASQAQALTLEKIQTIASFFPQLFVVNQPIFFQELVKAYGDDVDKYSTQLPIASQGGIPASQGASPEATPTPTGALPSLPKL